MERNEQTPVIYGCLKAVVTGGKGYGISHSWDGSVLTVSSDSGSSSADLMGPAGAPLFVAEIRLEDGAYVSDKTFEELKEHIEAGDVVVCELVGADSRTRCPMTTYTDYSAVFVVQTPFGEDEYFVLTSEGLMHTVVEKEEKLPSAVRCVLADNALTVTAVYSSGEAVTVIALDEEGNPLSVARDGKNCALTWEGFDE